MKQTDSSIAIVGIGGIYPDAPDLTSFWNCIRDGLTTSREVPEGRWLLPVDSVFKSEIGAADRVYSKHGCFISDIPSATILDGLAIDPTILEGLDPLFHLLIHAGKRAFDDAITEPLDRSRVGVIIGNLALPCEKSAQLTRTWLGRTFEEQLLGQSTKPPFTSPLNRYVSGLPAGILAQALGLNGGNFTLDAACASSLYSIKLAADELLAGRVDAMLCGGVSRPDPLYTQMGFSQLRALSKRGICSPFDEAGDGLVVGEGAGLFLLKRTMDALTHGDHIYGIVRGIGLTNDVGGSLLAPMSEGQLRSMRTAYVQAGWSPEDVDLIECHATGTPIGDAIEVSSLQKLWGNAQIRGERCVIGSVKSNIGHLLTAAGGAALTKVLLAMQAKTLPPTANFNTPQSCMDLEKSPFRVLKSAIPWQRRSNLMPLRAAVSAFGFGGINAHLLVEEWLPENAENIKKFHTIKPIGDSNSKAVAVIGMDARFGPWQTLLDFQKRVLGGNSVIQPTSPSNWWGINDSKWFNQEGLNRYSFKGFYQNNISIAIDQFRIPPRELEEMLPQQLLMLQSAACAMLDAGLKREENLNTGVFIGIAHDLNSTNFSLRWSLANYVADWATKLGYKLTTEELDLWTEQLRNVSCPPLNANRTMGALGNIVASRIAREFRVGGPSFTISSEENSGIHSLETAVRLIQTGQLAQALVGAVDLAGDPRTVLALHAVKPLSKTGNCLPFDQQADGAVVGEGACAVVLKRLSDAERDGDKIYAVIRGIGSSSGNCSSLNSKSYLLALQRAYDDAEISPATVGYLEASASGNTSEDLVEATVLSSFFTTNDSPTRSCGVSSIKADIGHSGAASGLASFVRGCMALHQQIIPACRGVISPCNAFSDTGQLYLPRKSHYWLRNRIEGPRRAGISSCSMDGSCSHIVLEERNLENLHTEMELRYPVGDINEYLFAFAANDPGDLLAEIELYSSNYLNRNVHSIYELANIANNCFQNSTQKKLALAIVARNHDELLALLKLGKQMLSTEGGYPETPPTLRDRLFYSPDPLGPKCKIAFVFPGSGNHYLGMGMELFNHWPNILRLQDRENLFLRNHFQPEIFWNSTSSSRINDNLLAAIFAQVSIGCAVSDLVQSFGVQPSAVIGYSLGESTGLFAMRTWHDRDAMYTRMKNSTLFSQDLAGECRAARQSWELLDDDIVKWSIGVVNVKDQDVRQALRSFPRAYLLIVNTPDECVIGGDSESVAGLVAALDCRFFPLHGVTTVHCEVALPVADSYFDLHLFPTEPSSEITYYSGVKGGSYYVTRESAANSILGQALHGINYPAVIESAYQDGVRLFLEMGPGASCSRMIDRILDNRPHLARSACFDGQDPFSSILRLLASLVAERVSVDISQLFNLPQSEPDTHSAKSFRSIAIGGGRYKPMLPKVSHQIITSNNSKLNIFYNSGSDQELNSSVSSENPLLRQVALSQQAQLKAHEAFLNLNNTLTQSMALAFSLEASLQQFRENSADSASLPLPYPLNNNIFSSFESPLSGYKAEKNVDCVFNRDSCLEFARGSVSTILGSEFSVVDGFRTRVRLPDEPLMLVDRILNVEGIPKSLSSGRVVTEHDIHLNSWYLDGGRIPTCIAVEAGQADLFLSSYLGIDFITRGLAVYRLLDAVVTFHRDLPGPGETIQYDIHIERFFRQGNTWLFRFFFEATVSGQPLISMRDGCAGFFSSQELSAGKGIVRPAIDIRTTIGVRPTDWNELVPMAVESYDDVQLDRLRNGDLAGCFGSLFAGLLISHPLTIPSGRMRLVHRVIEIDPTGGRCGIGIIRAEADIHSDDWFITCHFVDDKVMPGTLMYECCMHTLRIFLIRLGWVAESHKSVWEPVPGVASRLCCRGQVLETTKSVMYEVTLREIGYRPEPYVIVDALMYADSKAIVEITNMSVQLTGTTKEQLTSLWNKRSISFVNPSSPIKANEKSLPCFFQAEKRIDNILDFRKPAIYDKKKILAYSNGNPSEGFGELYRVFDSDRKIARLPGPPFQFMDRITAVRGEPWKMTAGAMAEAQYDLLVDAWFFGADRQPRMPFSILLEAALQPCGWLAAYVGSALTNPNDIFFRNLGGTAIQHRPVTPESGILTCNAIMKKVSTSGGMIIQEFDFNVADKHNIIYAGNTMFGFFSEKDLANQVGIRDAKPYLLKTGEVERSQSLIYPEVAPFPDKQLRMIDHIEMFVPDGGPHGLGYIRGIKHVDPDEWFFKAHFYNDPVTPGSLGLEAFLQLVKFAAVDLWKWQDGNILTASAMEKKHHWLYRGQVVPTNKLVTVEAWITDRDDDLHILTADGFLSVDGKIIYQMNDFTVMMESQ